MSNFVAGKHGKIYRTDGKFLSISDKSDVHIRSSNGNRWILKNIQYIFELKKSLISVGQLDAEGYMTTFGGGAWRGGHDRSLWHEYWYPLYGPRRI